MTNENYNDVKKKYDELIAKRESFTQLEEKIKKLKEVQARLELDLNVQAYVSTLDQINELNRMLPSLHEKEELSDENILTIAANQVKINQGTNNIYVCLGTFDYSDDTHSSVVELPDNTTDFGWKIYKNIEIRYYGVEENIPYGEVRKFEAENTILYAPKGIDARIFYKKVNTVFFDTLIKVGQEEAVKKVIDNFGVNSKLSSISTFDNISQTKMENNITVSEKGPILVKKDNK